jgi:hypothetical protein
LFGGHILRDHTLQDPVETAIASLHDGIGIYPPPVDILAFLVCSLFYMFFHPDIFSRRIKARESPNVRVLTGYACFSDGVDIGVNYLKLPELVKCPCPEFLGG